MMRRILALGIAVLLACGRCGPTVTTEAEGASPAPLRAFYARLAALESGQSSRVAILQIGDSHTANDAFSGRLRELMQARFGDGGRGLLPPGIPYRYYKPAVVTVAQDGWEVRRSARDPGPFGFAAVRQHASGLATMTLAAAPPDLGRVYLHVLAQPAGGTLSMAAADGAATSASTAAATFRTFRVQAPSGPASDAVALQSNGDGPVDLLAWSAERDTPGVTWSNLGTVGATMDLVGTWTPALLRAEADWLKPGLIILAFGTNEGFKDGTDLQAYPGMMREALQRLRGAAPSATILVLGPPAGVRAAGSPADMTCPDDPAWAVPVNLVRIRDIERHVAATQGLFFYDWAASMGGDCAIVRWAQTDPPLAAPDHVHMFKPGYQRTAEQFFATLMQGYDAYRASR